MALNLYINACVRRASRTDELAKTLMAGLGTTFKEVKLEEADLQPLSEARLAYRDDLIKRGAFDDPMCALANDFASAETIVMAAPYWDSSFPSLLKLYVENIYVTGLVTKYGPDGRPQGLCRAKTLYYVVTAGGPYDPTYSFDYIKDLCQNFFGISEVVLVKAEWLDVNGHDAAAIMEEAKAYVQTLLMKNSD